MFWTWVQDKMDEQGIPSIRELEKKAGVSNGTISVRKNQLKLPTVVIAEGLCQALRVTWVELWAQAGYVPPGALDTHISPEEREHIRLLRHLNPDRREAALLMLRGLAQGMTGHYTFIPARETDLTIDVYREILELADRDLYFDAVLKLLANTTTEQQLAISRKLDQLDAEEDAAHEAGVIPGGSRTT